MPGIVAAASVTKLRPFSGNCSMRLRSNVDPMVPPESVTTLVTSPATVISVAAAATSSTASMLAVSLTVRFRPASHVLRPFASTRNRYAPMDNAGIVYLPTALETV